MSNYSRIYDFEAKDGLTTGNPAKLIKGSEVDAELDAVATAISTKRDSSDATLASTLTTRGDLAVQGASAAQRLAIGTSGQQLISDGTDPVWTTKPGWQFVDKLDAFDGTTQAEFTDLDAGYDHLFEVRMLRPETDAYFQMRTSTTNGAGSPGYDETTGDYITSYIFTDTSTGAVDGTVSATNTMWCGPYQLESTSSGLNGMTGDFLLTNIDTGIAATVMFDSFGTRTDGFYFSAHGFAQRKDTVAVDAIKFFASVDEIAGGAIYHYRKVIGS